MDKPTGRRRVNDTMKSIFTAASSFAALIGAVAAQENPDQLLWGDTHLHTNRSVDAYFLENRSADADTAYRFAKGEPVVHPYHRAKVQIETPLDFLAVTDHAGMLGVPYSLLTMKDKRLTQTRLGKRLIELDGSGRRFDAFGLFLMGINTVGLEESERPAKIGALTALRWRIADMFLPADNTARAVRWLSSDPTLMGDLIDEDLFRWKSVV